MSQRRVRRATAAVYRALADPPGVDSSRRQTAAVDVPQTARSMLRTPWRGQIDALAMRARFSDARDYARFEPPAGAARHLFWMLEQNRVEALGALAFAGMRCNLAALAGDRWLRARPEAVIRGPGEAWVETFALLARQPLGAPLPLSVLDVIAGGTSWLSVAEREALTRLAQLLHDQVAYSVHSLRLVSAVLDAAPPTQPLEPTADNPGKRAPAEESAGVHGVSHIDIGDEATVESSLAGRQTVPDTAGLSVEFRATAQPYQAYTRSFDVEVRADELVDAVALVSLRAELDGHVETRMSETNRWAQRLRRKLTSLQARAWQFDCEDGQLDAARLTRIVTRPLEPMVFRREMDSEFPATMVTLLVDNSGSMRGRPIATAAVCAELLGRVMEKCNVKTEILGFTTRDFSGGLAHRQWTSAGRMAHPGRLTDLRHIIYKAADETWRHARSRMGAMLHGELLKENVDGEALLWAYGRLLRHPEPRRILIVISDGAPLDEMTSQVNDHGYLDRHLREVVTQIDRSPVRLAAIGIGHDVTRYYRRAVVLNSVDELGEAIVTQLFGFLDGSEPRGAAA